jgi:hypothetical protein
LRNWSGWECPLWVKSGPICQAPWPVIEQADEDAFTRANLALAAQYGRYSHRRIARQFKDPGQGGIAAGLEYCLVGFGRL